MNASGYIVSHTGFPAKAVQNTVDLLTNAATIPFIARYRKELTGNLDEVEIEKVSTLLKAFLDLEKRKETVLKSLLEQEVLSEELKTQLQRASSVTEVEDLYLPFKKKRKTKADTAREAGLEPFAKIILDQKEKNLNGVANRFLNKEVPTVDDAFEGAKNIIAQWISEDPKVREQLRQLYSRKAVITSRILKTESEKPASQKYFQYFEWEEPLKRIPSHRFLAIFRAAKEGILRLKVEIDKSEALHHLSRHIIQTYNHPSTRHLYEALEDAFSRLLRPSFQSEFTTEAKKKADEEAIKVFAGNLEQLLLSPPLGEKRILAIDPGFKSGCKIVCLDEKGALLHNETIFPHPPQREGALAGRKIKSLVNAYKIDAISIGNGTASRETEDFIKKTLFDKEVLVFVVNEAGASVYSASKVAREEFPNYDVTVRGAVSIGRRLIDPLAELVKIDPKSIGVGQYQHEVAQSLLKEKLEYVVMSCVNRIGVNVNTASKELLSYVSGIGPSLAGKIISYRSKKGAIKTRQELLSIPGLGPKAFEQAAGFLRIKEGSNPLDDSAVHPERYNVVEKIAKDVSLKVENLMGNKSVLGTINLEKYKEEDLHLPTLKDIIKELEKPGVDPRPRISAFHFDSSVQNIDDLSPGMTLPGIVNNITNFGCFVDIGIKESGLIHISNLAKGFVSDVNAVVKLNQQIMVKILDVDKDKKRIQLALVK